MTDLKYLMLGLYYNSVTAYIILIIIYRDDGFMMYNNLKRTQCGGYIYNSNHDGGGDSHRLYGRSDMSMNIAPFKRPRPQNVPGNLYVDESCIDCDACRWICPSVFNR